MTRLPLLLLAGATLMACTPAESDPVATPTPSPAPASAAAKGAIPEALGGAEWTVFEVGGQPVEGVTMLFLDGRVAGRGGCNRYTGPVSFKGASGMTVGPAAMTMMACPDPQMAIEQRFSKALEQVTGYAVAPDGTLVLSGTSGPLMRARRPVG